MAPRHGVLQKALTWEPAWKSARLRRRNPPKLSFAGTNNRDIEPVSGLFCITQTGGLELGAQREASCLQGHQDMESTHGAPDLEMAGEEVITLGGIEGRRNNSPAGRYI